MASSRKPSSIDLKRTVAAALAPGISPGTHVVVGLSGGVDSVVLLSIVADLAPEMRFSLRAVHVNHGISPNAGDWAEFCARLCGELKIPLQVEPVDVSRYRALGLEGAARRARYDVFSQIDADVLAVAHHRDDQVETFLLQLLRGAGMRGLSAMPRERPLAGSRARLVRPLLEVPRSEIERYARSVPLTWIEDESNADVARKRNFLRHDVLPLLERQFPATRDGIARGAGHLAEAAALLHEMARSDLDLAGATEVDLGILRELGNARAKNVVRYLCEERGIRIPSAARLEELMRQLTGARRDALVSVSLSGWSFHRYRDRLCLEPLRPAPLASYREQWGGENALPMLALGGVLRFKPEEGRGVSVARLRGEVVTVRLRQGGERLQPDCRRPRRTLKNLLQEHGVPPWRRERLPLVFSGENLVSAPGVGDDCAYQAQRGEAGLIISWETLDPGN